MTRAQMAALLWLRNRGGDAVFGNGGRLLAAGEWAPAAHGTWSHLREAGMVERYAKRRLRVTAAGFACDLTGVSESRSLLEPD